MDTLTKAERSERMSRIRSKDTKPEMVVRRALHALGYRYRLHRRNLPGAPDIVFPSRRKVIFVHGCFWHGHEGCKVANVPKSRQQYWLEKFARNKVWDHANLEALRQAGWDALVIWECETKAPERIATKAESFLSPAAKERFQ